MGIKAVCLTVLALATTPPAWAGRPADGMYYGVKGTPANDIDGGAMRCPGTAKLQHNTLIFEGTAANGTHPLSYGVWKLPLDASGAFHGSYVLPKRAKPRFEIELDPPERAALYRDLESVTIDVTSFEPGGGGAGLFIEITLPTAEGAGEPDHCRHTLLHVPTPKPPKQHAKYDGAYWAHAGSGGGSELLQCPSDILVMNGKVYLGVPAQYTSWVVSDLPIKNDRFETDITISKFPSNAQMERAGYFADDLAQLRGGMSFHVAGRFAAITERKSNKRSSSLDLEVTSKDGNASCTATFLMQGFDLGDGYVDCDSLSASQLARHPVCN